MLNLHIEFDGTTDCSIVSLTPKDTVEHADGTIELVFSTVAFPWDPRLLKSIKARGDDPRDGRSGAIEWLAIEISRDYAADETTIKFQEGV